VLAGLEHMAPPAARPVLTNIQKIRKIEETLEREIRPALKQDGGDIELVDVIGNRVLVATRGACAVCQASQQTLKNFVEAKLRSWSGPIWSLRRCPSENRLFGQQRDDSGSSGSAGGHDAVPHGFVRQSLQHAHLRGQVGKKVAEAREQVAALLGAEPGEIIFTSCGSESDNAAIRSALASQPGKRHIVTSRVEHPAIRALCAHLANEGTA